LLRFPLSTSREPVIHTVNEMRWSFPRRVLRLAFSCSWSLKWPSLCFSFLIFWCPLQGLRSLSGHPGHLSSSRFWLCPMQLVLPSPLFLVTRQLLKLVLFYSEDGGSVYFGTLVPSYRIPCCHNPECHIINLHGQPQISCFIIRPHYNLRGEMHRTEFCVSAKCTSTVHPDLRLTILTFILCLFQVRISAKKSYVTYMALLVSPSFQHHVMKGSIELSMSEIISAYLMKRIIPLIAGKWWKLIMLNQISKKISTWYEAQSAIV
jgi:hypothetical protein